MTSHSKLPERWTMRYVAAASLAFWIAIGWAAFAHASERDQVFAAFDEAMASNPQVTPLARSLRQTECVAYSNAFDAALTKRGIPHHRVIVAWDAWQNHEVVRVDDGSDLVLDVNHRSPIKWRDGWYRWIKDVGEVDLFAAATR